MRAERFGIENMKALGRRLRALREARQWSLKRLSSACGVSVSAIQNIERGQSNPSLMTIMLLVDCLGISIDQLIADAQAAEVQINVTRKDDIDQTSGNGTLDGDLSTPAMRGWIREISSISPPEGIRDGEAVFGYLIHGALQIGNTEDVPPCSVGDAFHAFAGSECLLRPASGASTKGLPPRLLLVSTPMNGSLND